MTQTPFEVKPIDLSDSRMLDEAAVVATRAFQFDPFFVHLAPKPLIRARGLALFWRSELGVLGDRAEPFGAFDHDGRLIGVSVWVKPGGYPLPIGAQLRQAAGAFRALIPQPSALVMGSKYLLAIDKAHPREPLWYLLMLVTDPPVQRRGIGGALQEVILEKADAEGLSAYLETQNAHNLPYYRRFGYEVVEELHPVAGGPPLWTMRREPKG